MIARLGVVLLCFAAAGLHGQTPTWTTGTYVYDGSGNIESIGGRPFIYDELGRLTYGKVDATHGETYGYDGFGNIVTIQKDGQTIVSLGAVASTNRMTDQAAHAWAVYNPDGSIAWTMNGDTFEYDGLGMVKESEVASTRRFYLYSPSDERIASVRIQGNNTAGNREWTIRNPSGAVLTRFTQTPSNAWSWDEDYAYANGQLLAANVSAPEKVRHFFPDHLGTPRVITGNGGAELSRHTYYAFGEEVTSTASTERLKFTGHERDDPTLDYMHARYYAPKWGRFLSVDPEWASADFGSPQSWNRYAYVRNNPLNRTDPDGRLDDAIALSMMFDCQLNNCRPNPKEDMKVVKAGVFAVSLVLPGPEDLLLSGYALKATGRFFGAFARELALSRKVMAAVRSSDAAVRLEGRAAVALSDTLVGFQKSVKGGEIDVETTKAIVEVTGGRSPGKLEQILKYINNREINPDGKAVVVYAPNLSPHAARTLEKAGATVVRTLDELRDAAQ
jgi:RHS repeat-associated protein